MTVKKGIRVVCFLVIIGLVIIFLEKLIGVDQTVLYGSRQRGYYMQPKDSLDVVLLGRSMVDTDWECSIAWEQGGVTTFPLSSNDQPFSVMTNLIEEVEKRQTPKLYIVDVHGIRENAMEDVGPSLRVVADNMPFSINKVKMIQNASKWEEKYKEAYHQISEDAENKTIASDLSYYFGFFNNHARWEKMMNKEEWNQPLKLTDSLVSVGRKETAEAQREPDPSTEAEWSPLAAELFTEFLDYCDEENIPVLFVSLPTIGEEYDYMQMNAALELAEERGFPTLNMNTSEAYQEIGLEFDGDYADTEHLNVNGAVKVTEYLTDYLVKNYEFTDKRGDKAYAHWDSCYNQ